MVILENYLLHYLGPAKDKLKKLLILTQEEPYRQTFIISEATQLGVGKTPIWHVKRRKKPKRFKELDLLVTVEGSSFISRNHAGIIRGDNEKDDGEKDDSNTFYLVDLNSLNGTYINGKRLKKEEEVALSKGDKIKFAKEFELTVAGTRYMNQNHHALLVGHEGNNLIGVEPDLKMLANQLNKRGFAGNIATLLTRKTDNYRGEATKTKILKGLEDVAGLATQNSYFIFYYSGHGNKEGLCVSGGTIKPEDLYSRLGNIRGKKAVILDCCYAGSFIMTHEEMNEMSTGGTFFSKVSKALIPDDTLVLAGSSMHEKAYEAPAGTIAHNQYMGRFTAALVRYMNQNRERFNLADLKTVFEEAMEGSPFYTHHQKPVFGNHKKSYTIMTACLTAPHKALELKDETINSGAGPEDELRDVKNKEYSIGERVENTPAIE